jgi:Dimerisation domain
MAETIQVAPQSLPPHVQLIQMGTGGAVAQVVQIAAKIGLADHFADGPRSAAELARPLDLHAPSLHRLMRTMASLGLLTEGEAQRFSLTKLGGGVEDGRAGLSKGNPAYDRQQLGGKCLRQPSSFPANSLYGI